MGRILVDITYFPVSGLKDDDVLYALLKEYLCNLDMISGIFIHIELVGQIRYSGRITLIDSHKPECRVVIGAAAILVYDEYFNRCAVNHQDPYCFKKVEEWFNAYVQDR